MNNRSHASVTELLNAAKKARDCAYAPYSGHCVGAAIRTQDGSIFSGCNVENSSFGATICAERVAIHSAVAALGKVKISEVLVVTDTDPPWPPCGICRQVISEFGGPETKIYTANLKKMGSVTEFSGLFPDAFVPGHLQKTQGQ